MRSAVIFAIGIYRRFLSPHKGFRCAGSVLYGVPSCSNVIEQACREQSLTDVWRTSRSTFKRCSMAAKTLGLNQTLLASIHADEDVDDKPEEKKGRKRKRDTCVDAVTACDCGTLSIRSCSLSGKPADAAGAKCAMLEGCGSPLAGCGALEAFSCCSIG